MFFGYSYCYIFSELGLLRQAGQSIHSQWWEWAARRGSSLFQCCRKWLTQLIPIVKPQPRKEFSCSDILCTTVINLLSSTAHVLAPKHKLSKITGRPKTQVKWLKSEVQNIFCSSTKQFVFLLVLWVITEFMLCPPGTIVAFDTQICFWRMVSITVQYNSIIVCHKKIASRTSKHWANSTDKLPNTFKIITCFQV